MELKINAMEQDILTEIGSICAGNATTALAETLGRKIELKMPTVNIINSDKLSFYLNIHPEDIIIGVHMQVFGEARGNALVIFLKKNAFRLVDILVGPMSESGGNLTEIGISALKEMGNIIVASYMSALSAFAGISTFPSTATFTSGSVKSLVKLAFSGFKEKEDAETILIEAVFMEKKRELEGNFFVIFDAISIKEILIKAKAMLKKK
jgi:chemotaxis protein CheC